MIDLEGVEHHDVIKELVEVLCNKTQNTDTGFFKTEIAYFLGKMASMMRATIVTRDRGEIPVNIYALALATSGYGKGYSVSIIEDTFMGGFRKRFMEDTFPVVSDQNLWKIANAKAAKNNTNQQEEFNSVERDFIKAGAFPFTFDSGTPPAVKQLREKLLYADIGAINLQIDEIGSNLMGSTDVLTLFLELFDQGKVKQKLVKNTVDNTRVEELDGKTPTNMLLFGTPAKLFDGGQTEDQFYSFLEIGYARRCLFGMGQHKRAGDTMSAAEVYNHLVNPLNKSVENKWFNEFHQLANPAMYNWKMDVPEDVGIQLIAYKIACERFSDALPDHEEIRKAEINHRYFKALKLAGAYAFVDRSSEIEMGHLMSAILLVEESGKSFQQILNREKTYVKLAKYIADVGTEVTHADLHESLPFYTKGTAARNEMMTMATAWGYKRHIIIKKSFIDGIEFFKGEQLEETDINKLILSYSDNFAYNYEGQEAPFDQLPMLTQEDGLHWANHQFKNEHRSEETVLPGFNMIVLDVDGGTTLEMVHELLKDFKFMTYTTKRHTEENHRFRLIIPINYVLELDQEEYKQFINSVIDWLPFEVDSASNQRSKKWETYANGEYFLNDEGEIFDALDFIPKTSRNEAYQTKFQSLQSLDSLERWFATKISEGNRNNNMIKYALALVDNNMNITDVTNSVLAFNRKLGSPLEEHELESTVLVTAAKRYQERMS